MDTDKLAKIIEAEVRKALTDQANNPKSSPSGKKVLALFTGGYVKLSEALIQLNKLIQGSCLVDVVMSQSAVKVIGQDKILKISGINSLICEPDDSVSSLKLVQKSDIVVIPILTRNSATKVALGITDTLVTNIIMQALISAKPIIAARNSADPNDADCPCVGMPNTSPALIKLAENYLQKLESYGMKLVDVSEIAKIILTDTDKSDSLDQKLVTQDVIAKLPQDTKQITIRKGSIITPLAKDIAKERGIKIVFI